MNVDFVYESKHSFIYYHVEWINRVFETRDWRLETQDTQNTKYIYFGLTNENYEFKKHHNGMMMFLHQTLCLIQSTQGTPVYLFLSWGNKWGLFLSLKSVETTSSTYLMWEAVIRRPWIWRFSVHLYQFENLLVFISFPLETELQKDDEKLCDLKRSSHGSLFSVSLWFSNL
jgi:hypothetical protein